ncbi:hypothetical protein IP92_01628 [Pseudoduganella flava]|uniref:Uncharacterized protein n=1 Tax=Pseudoduganella flava TaxID=871742 RepID=A0A562Q147_9BURK|nr:hypothetical protein [Pseudoduganella flava]QGZ38088.1 hypothetical protein GO485_02845 [Pseudoduganella flava]TWI50399.1 hypothetical protein IP92_01628 [Pseudoduganella flava]
MKNTSGNPSPQAAAMLKALQDAVTQALERKRKLGQYAVVWQDGRPVMMGDDAPVKRDRGL